MQIEAPKTRHTLYKYIIIPKEDPTVQSMQLDQPTIDVHATQEASDSSAPPLLPRLSRKDDQSKETSGK